LADGNIFWYLNGRNFKTKENWFKALKKEFKIKMLFNNNFFYN